MTEKLLLDSTALSTFLAQSTACIAVGLLASFVLTRRSARAHQVLFLAMLAAVIMPTMSILVKHYQLGLFVAEPAAVHPELDDPLATDGYESSGPAAVDAVRHDPPALQEHPPSPIVTSEVPEGVPWLSLMFGLWLAVSLALAARLLTVFVLGIRLLKRATPLACPGIRHAARLAGRRLGIDLHVDVFDSVRVDGPVIWCWAGSPILLVPNGTSQSPNHIDWVSIFCHEFAHFKRRDHITGLFAELLVCLCPWNPLTWWARSRLIRLSEQACDDWVMAAGQSPTDYADALLDLAPQRQMAFMPAVVAGANGLATRVRRIIQDSCTDPRIGTRWTLALAILTICTSLAVAFAQTRPAMLEAPEDETQNVTQYPQLAEPDRPARRQMQLLPQLVEEQPRPRRLRPESVLEEPERLPHLDQRAEVDELLTLVRSLLVRLDRVEEELHQLHAENEQLKKQLQQHWIASSR